ncbi:MULTISPECIES: hypothetical protein [unclassified Rhizobium]|uniref:DUF7666 domain-containing protein n=1 Tax=unclassified Rhizobium TaxID=2613769 RepID=UPI00214BF582|nr:MULTISPECIES: hypothetical protein [unclassified Rhizobium]
MVKKSEKQETVVADDTVVAAIKGFNPDLKCRGYQFEVGKTFKHEGPVKACETGFHAIEGHPLEVFKYYAPSSSVFHEVEMRGSFSRHSEDSKIASAEITIKGEIKLPDLISKAVKYVLDRVSPAEGATNSGDRGAATNSGDSGAATNSGYSGAATNSGDSGAATNSGDRGAATNSGDRGAATNSGYSGAATNSGYRGAATNSGDSGAATNSGYSGAATNSGYSGAATNSGYRGAATNSGDRGAATNSGDRGAATNSGDRGAATNSGYSGAATNSGYSGAATNSGDRGAAMSSGKDGKVRGCDGTALFDVERGDWDGKGYPILSVACGIVGKEGIQPDVWYCAKDGKLVPA